LVYRTIDARAEYRREIDPQDKYVVSERTAFSFAALVAPLRLTGGLDYNIAEGHLGSADATATYVRRRLVLSGGVRRYRPYFSLWTLWSAFSPVPYYAANASVEVRASDRLTLRGRAERYRYDRANVSTALVPELETDGWRASAGGTLTLDTRWTVDASGGLEHGPGASARFADGAVRFVPNDRYVFDIHGGAMARPLELRYYDATSRWIGARGERQLGSARAVWVDVSLVDDERDRPDASASSLTQVRVRTGVSVSFGSNADRVPLPPGRPRGR
jgi:hypothetical protein